MNRLKNLRPFAVLLMSLLFAAANAQETSPNIVLINIDDLGWMDTSFSGNSYYETPNLDALSRNSLRFTQGYAAAANCAPSRASLLTGKWPQRHGILTVATSERGASKDRKIIPIKNTTTLHDSFTILPEVLSKHGYTTCHAGKWHVSEDPLQMGFQVNIGGNHDGHPASYYYPFKNVDLEAEEGDRLTDVITDKTIDFIKGTKAPFFINFAPYAVHTPIQAVPELRSKYSEKVPEEPGMGNPDYATMVENMDQNIGRLLKALESTGKLDKTLIVFTSDNGGLFSVSKQHPLRAGKGSYYEGGIRVPFLFFWQGKIAPGIREFPMTNLDLFPTFLAVADIQKPDTLGLDGADLSPILFNGGSLEERPLYWHFPVYLEAVLTMNENRDPKFRTRPGSAIRYGDWKLQYYYEDHETELFNLKRDPSESKNLADVFPKKTAALTQMLKSWLKETNAPIPTMLNPDFQE